MSNVIYTAAVMGSLCNCGAEKPGIIASVLAKLVEIDAKLTRFAEEEDKSGIDHTAESEELLEMAAGAVERLDGILAVEVYYNDEIPQGAKGRLRLELPGTPWDSAAPLFLS